MSFSGHGFGHGVGMGQWGALGYAIGQDNGIGPQSYQWILGHYYSPATLQSDGDATDTQNVSVSITANADQFTIVTSADGAGLTVPTGGTAQAVMFTPNGTGGWNEQTGPGCAGPWSAPQPAGPAPITSDVGGGLVHLCVPNVTLRGSVSAVYNSNGALRTFNRVNLSSYLADVVPSESPTSWGALGDPGPQGQPWGFQELEAQAVAARSFVLSNALGRGGSGYGGYADTCDSTACQSYPGVANENLLTDAAVMDTAGQVMVMPGGVVATTEYSASTGGYTSSGAEGSPFSPVVDDGDTVCVPGGFSCNPNHSWAASVAVSSITAQFPQIGALQAVNVTGRNGLGDLGGRATSVSLVGSSSTVHLTGAQFASDFGLRSDWFAVSAQASGGVGGYWLVGSDGGIFAFGDAGFAGSMGGRPLNRPVVGMAADPASGGYWLVASDGGIFAFGAPFLGSMGGHPLNQPVVGMAATPDGRGYWLVASDGGIFAFGDARFFGSTGSLRLNQPVVGMAATPDGGGYRLVASDGGIFALGAAAFAGSAAGTPAGAGAVAILSTRTDTGYLVVNGGGTVTNFGDAPQFGDLTTALPSFSGAVVGGAPVPG